MIFHPELAKKVMAGKKTQTRRLIKAGDKLILRGINSRFYGDKLLPAVVNFAKRGNKSKETPFLRWQTERDYAVQAGRGKKAIGRIRILKIEQKLLCQIPIRDVWAEGFEALQDFIDGWSSIYSEREHQWLACPPVWKLEFEVMK